MPNNNDHQPIPPELLSIIQARAKTISDWFMTFCESNPHLSDTLNVHVVIEFKDGLVMECSMLDIKEVMSGRTTIPEDPLLQPPIVVKRKGGVN